MTSAAFADRPLSNWLRVRTTKFTFLALLGLSAFVGCGKADPPKVAVFPVTGKLKLTGGEVPAGARVILHAVTRSEALPAGLSPSATVEKDGSFKVGTYDQADGAPPGEYKVTVEWFKLVTTPEESYNGPNVLPKEYASSESTPLKATVQSGPTELQPIEIDPKKK